MILQKRTLILLLSFLILLLSKILPRGSLDVGPDELIFLALILPRGSQDVGPDELLFLILLLRSLILPRRSLPAARRRSRRTTLPFDFTTAFPDFTMRLKRG